MSDGRGRRKTALLSFPLTSMIARSGADPEEAGGQGPYQKFRDDWMSDSFLPKRRKPTVGIIIPTGALPPGVPEGAGHAQVCQIPTSSPPGFVGFKH